MDSCNFYCFFEENEWRMRAQVHANEYLLLYEVEPEDKSLQKRFGIKFIVQDKVAFLDVRCSSPIDKHFAYEQSLLAGLRSYLLTQWRHR